MTSTSVYAQALSTPAPQAQAELTPGETEAVAKLVAHLDDAAYTLDGKPLDDQEKRWLVSARRGDVMQGKLHLLTPDHVDAP